MSELLHYVQSECPRGERRRWWVVKRGSRAIYDAAVPGTDRATEKSAQKLCDKLNEAAALTAKPGAEGVK